MLEAFAALRGRAAFALVTPPVNDAGLHRVGVLLDLLAAETAPDNVIYTDKGNNFEIWLSDNGSFDIRRL